jgi:hypothetical protein
VPAELEFPDVAEFIKKEYRPRDATRVYQTATPRQMVDPQHIDEMKMYEELMKEYTGKKAGGEIKMQAGGFAKLAKALKGTQEVLPAAERDANLAKMLSKSKVPETLYHGTGSDISEFRPNTFFSDDPRIAGMYAKSQQRAVEGSGPNIIPVKAKFENPYFHDESQSRKQGKNFSQMIAPDAPGKGRLQEALRILKEKGHDSVVLQNYDDIGGRQNQYIALDPSKVKSAIGNRGTYNTSKPEINEAIGGLIKVKNKRKAKA